MSSQTSRTVPVSGLSEIADVIGTSAPLSRSRSSGDSISRELSSSDGSRTPPASALLMSIACLTVVSRKASRLSVATSLSEDARNASFACSRLLIWTIGERRRPLAFRASDMRDLLACSSMHAAGASVISIADAAAISS